MGSCNNFHGVPAFGRARRALAVRACSGTTAPGSSFHPNLEFTEAAARMSLALRLLFFLFSSVFFAGFGHEGQLIHVAVELGQVDV